MTDPNYTHIEILADRSGSMMNIAADMNGGIRSYLEEQAKLPGIVTVSVTTFDDQIERPETLEDIAVLVAEPPVDYIHPRGSTALNDALGSTIVRLGEALAKLDEDRRPGTVIFVVVTDGQENSSRDWSTEKVKELVDKQTKDFNWTFVYLAANVDAFETGSLYGFAKGNTVAYRAGAAGVSNVYNSLNTHSTALRSAGAAAFTDEDRANAMAEDEK